MSLVELLPIIAPALLIVAAAVRLTTRERAGRDTVLDLRDVPTVVLATRDVAGARQLAPVRGALVHPGEGGTLGARMRSVPSAEVLPGDDGGAAASGRVVLVRRRRRPLVAVTREQSSR